MWRSSIDQTPGRFTKCMESNGIGSHDHISYKRRSQTVTESAAECHNGVQSTQ